MDFHAAVPSDVDVEPIVFRLQFQSRRSAVRIPNMPCLNRPQSEATAFKRSIPNGVKPNTTFSRSDEHILQMLNLKQTCVCPIPPHQFIMFTRFLDLAMFDHHDLIRMGDGR
jgi:hypothetical protein